jgi:dihydrolipoamide dehydrogenase
MAQYDVDIIVIGGGPGGYPAAIHAAKHGAKVALIDFDNAGGTCLNWGCIPTKTLIGSVTALETAKHGADFGLKIGTVEVDFPAVMARKDKIVKQLVDGVGFLLKKNKIRFIIARGRVVDPHTVEAISDDGKVETITTGSIIIATGSVPAPVPIPGLDKGGPDGDVWISNADVKKRKADGTLSKTTIWTSNDAVSALEVPKKLAIIGAGVIGCEFAFTYAALGAEVTLFEFLPNIISVVDTEISEELRKILEKRGIKIFTSTKVAAVDIPGKKLKYVSEKNGDGEAEFDKLLVSVGRRGFIDGLGLEALGVEIIKGKIPVNEFMQTNVPSIYAIGDVTNGKYGLAHVATREGEVAADNILGHPTKMDYKAVPACIYTEPEVAATGLTEQEAKDLGYDVQVGKFSFRALGKALAINENIGLVKIVSEKKYGEILGAHIIGPHASDLIHEVVVSIKLESTIEELMSTIHAHPSLSEAVMEAAQDVKGESVHK